MRSTSFLSKAVAHALTFSHSGLITRPWFATVAQKYFRVHYFNDAFAPARKRRISAMCRKYSLAEIRTSMKSSRDSKLFFHLNTNWILPNDFSKEACETIKTNEIQFYWYTLRYHTIAVLPLSPSLLETYQYWQLTSIVLKSFAVSKKLIHAPVQEIGYVFLIANCIAGDNRYRADYEAKRHSITTHKNLMLIQMQRAQRSWQLTNSDVPILSECPA